MLDKISKKILAELQNDGRISNVELASRVNLSPAACLEKPVGAHVIANRLEKLWPHAAG